MQCLNSVKASIESFTMVVDVMVDQFLACSFPSALSTYWSLT